MPTDTTQDNDSSAWLTPRKFCGLLALLLLASYPEVLLGVKTFVHRDFAYFSYPIACHFRESFWHGELPHWNPLSNCGAPFLAQWNTQVLYPPVLFYLLLPLSWALGVFCLLHLFVGGLGMFYLARTWTHNSFAAAFAGVVFAFNGLALNSLMWPATVAALAGMPWVVWLTSRTGREGGRMILWAALAGALQMLTGGVEVILFTWVIAGALALLECAQEKPLRIGGLWRFGLVILLVAGLCAAQLLPFLDLLDQSRGQESIGSTQWPMPRTGWLNFLLPIFRCHAYQGVFMQENQMWTSSYYVGAATLALAVLALVSCRQPRFWLLAGLTLFCLILALGDATPVYYWLSQHVSAFNLMRYPVKFVILPVFVLPLLAACGLAEKQPANQFAHLKLVWWGIVVGLAAMLGALIWWTARFTPLNEFRQDIFQNGLMRLAFLAALVVCLTIARKNLQPKTRQKLVLLVLVLAWLDLFQQAPQPRTADPSIYLPKVQQSASLPRAGESRAFISANAQQQLLSNYQDDLAGEYIGRRFALFLNCNLLDDVPKVDGFFPLYLRSHVAVTSGDPTAPLLDFMGVSQTLVISNGMVYWQPRPTHLPLITAGQKPVFANVPAAWLAVTGANFHPQFEVYLPLEARASVNAGIATNVTISLVKFSAQRIEAESQSAVPAMVVVAQTWHHAWRAFVDEQPVPLWQANLAFQAFEVPSGRHQIKLVYEDRLFYLGLGISLMTLTVVLFLFWKRPKCVD